MKVLLTGPFGKIGYRVVEALLADGHEVTCFDLETPGNRKTAGDFGSRVKVIWGDITNPASVTRAVEGQDAVIHNAAIIPPLSDLNPALAESVNVGGTKNILAAIERREQKPLLVFPSSISVHGYNAPDSPWPKKITAPFRAEDCYAGHKIQCEQLVEEAGKQWGLRWVIVRIGACMEGRNPMDTENSEEMLRMMFSIAAKARIEYIHPKDVATAMARAIRTPEAIGKKFFLGGGKSCQEYWGEFNSLFLVAMCGVKFPETAFGTQGYYTDWMDTEESQRILQFQQHSLDDYRAELAQKFRWVRPFARPFGSLVLNYMLSKSPNYKKS